MLLQKSNLLGIIISTYQKNLIRGSFFQTTRTFLRQGFARTSSEASEMSTDSKGNKKMIALGQMKSTNDKEHNMRQVEELVRRAKEQKAEILFLPETCDFVGEHRKQTLELSEPLTGQTMQRYQALAKDNCMWLSLGGVHESTSDESGKIYNSHVLLDSEGRIVKVYRKLHLFHAETLEFRFRESDVVCPGQKLEHPVDTPFGKIGLQICYDLRFPEASILLKKQGAEILTYPAAFTFTTGKAHWETLLRARAIENQCFVVAAAQLGQHNPKRRSWGHAMIIDPWGKVLADCGGEDELCIATSEINLDLIRNISQNMPCFEHRRDDIYSLIAYKNGTVCATEDRYFAENVINKDTIFFESEHCYAFTNLRCVVEGHVLVSTKRVTPRLNGLNCAEIADLFSTVCMIQRMLESFYKTTSATVTVQDGLLAGQTVPHVHFHVMPRRNGDFPHNDQIYVKLDDRCEDKPCRTIEERIEEAQTYRKFILDQQ